jgi:hypothetical protein
VLAYVAYALPPLTREEHAIKAKVIMNSTSRDSNYKNRTNTE